SGSPLSLIAQGIFVYLRGAVVFYAWRALEPRPEAVRRFPLVLAPLVAPPWSARIFHSPSDAPPSRQVGWTDTTWADINRAQGLFRPPNALGHLLALPALGLAALLATRPRRPARWWVVSGVVLLALAASQSRESILATLVGLVVIAL